MPMIFRLVTHRRWIEWRALPKPQRAEGEAPVSVWPEAKYIGGL